MQQEEVQPNQSAALVEFTVFRKFSYSCLLHWKCSLCPAVGNVGHSNMHMLISNYERHLRIFHNLEPEESPF